MANKIKGITVEIGGDTKGLSKALTDVNKEIKSTKSQLKDVERLLKLDPTNTNLLQQRQKLLAQAVKETSDKLSALKQASEQAASTKDNYDAYIQKFTPIKNEIDKTDEGLEKLRKKMEETAKADGPESEKYKALETQVSETEAKLKDLRQQGKEVRDEFGNPVSPEQWDGLQREIIETELELERLENQTSKLSSVFSEQLQQAGKKISAAGDKVSDAGAKMLPVSVAISGIGVAAVKTTADFDTAMSNVQALSGATAEDLQRLRDYAIEMGSTTAFSASEAADALGYMALAGWGTDESIAALPAVLNLAAAANMDLARASDMVTDYLSAFGMEASDAAYLSDMLAYAQANSNTSAEQLGDAYKNCAANLHAAGQDVETVTSMLEAMANQGVKGGEAGTALSAIMRDITSKMDAGAISIGDVSVAVQDESGDFRDLTDILTDVEKATSGMGDAQKAAALSATFTADSTKGLNLIFSEGVGAVSDYEQALRGSLGTASEQADTRLDNLNGQVTLLKSALEGAAISIGDTLVPMISELVGYIQQAVDWFNSLDDEQKRMIVSIGLVIAAIGPMLIMFGKTISSIGSIVDGIGKIGPAISFITGTVLPALQTGFTSVFSFIAANPIVLLIAAIVALVALIVTKGDEIQAILQKVDAFLQGVFATDWTTIFGPVLGNILNSFFANLKNIWDSILQIFNGVIDFIRGVFTGDWERAWNGVKEIFGGIFSGLVGLAKAPINAIIGFINSAIGALNMLISGLNRIPGVNIGQIGTIPLLASGGTVLRGSAIVGEAGPELLTVAGGKTVVQPLTNNNTTNNATNLGGVNITVYGAPGQDVHELANILMDEFQYVCDKREAGIHG